MIIAVDFDGVVVKRDSEYDAPLARLELVHGALEGLLALRRADHTLILYSARANRGLREDWRLNPLWASGLVPLSTTAWSRNVALHEARLKQMQDFVKTRLPAGIFAAIDDGNQGKVVADLFIDDNAFGAPLVNGNIDWYAVTKSLGEK